LKLGTQQGDPLGGALFALAHLCALHLTIIAERTCVFHLLANDTHIVGLALDVVPIFLRLQHEFLALGLSM